MNIASVGAKNSSNYDLPSALYQLSSTHETMRKRLKQRLHERLVELMNCSGSSCRVAEGS